MRHYAYSRFLERRFILSRFFFMLEQGDSLTTIVLSAEGRNVQHYDPTSTLALYSHSFFFRYSNKVIRLRHHLSAGGATAMFNITALYLGGLRALL
jgi:hypothetical protein